MRSNIAAGVALVAALFCTPCAWGQAAPVLEIEEGSPEAALLNEINDETDPAKRLELTKSFERLFPKSHGVRWVLYQALQIHRDKGDDAAALAVCARLRAVEPDSLPAALAALKIAEKGATDLLLEQVELAVKAAGLHLAEPAPRAEETPVERKERLDLANEIVQYAEYALFTRVNREPATKTRLMDVMARLFPKGQYLASLKNGAAVTSAKTFDSPESYVGLADQAFQSNPERCAAMAQKALEMINGPKPEGFPEEAWQKSKSLTGRAYYLLGAAQASLSNYAAADRSLRAAVSRLQGNEQLLAAAYYYLGWANFKLAEASTDKTRVNEAIRFTEQCANIRGSLQVPAVRNLELIRRKYNLH